MVATSFGTTDPRTQTKWSKQVFEYALKDIKLSPLFGTDTNSAIVINSDLQKSAGDNVIFEMVSPFVGVGFGEDGAVATDEEALVVNNFKVTVNQRGKSALSSGLMSQQRTDIDLRTTFRNELARWYAQALEGDLVQALSGVYNISTVVATVNVKVPSSARILYAGEKADGSGYLKYTTDALLSAATATDALMGVGVIAAAKRKALLSAPKMRPIRIDGGDYFLMLLHPYQVKAIKQQTGVNGWASIQKDANTKGPDNPLFKGALGLYDGVLLWEYDRILTRTGAGSNTPTEGFLLAGGLATTTDPVASGKTVARALLLGAQAGAIAFGEKAIWTEFMDDGGRKPRVTIDTVYGASKTQFATAAGAAQEDYGVICVDTQVVID